MTIRQSGIIYFFPSKICQTGLEGNIISSGDESDMEKEPESEITYYGKDFIGFLPHNKDLVVITMQYDNWNMKRVLIDPRNS